MGKSYWQNGRRQVAKNRMERSYRAKIDTGSRRRLKQNNTEDWMGVSKSRLKEYNKKQSEQR
jgi:hypothetical protein